MPPNQNRASKLYEQSTRSADNAFPTQTNNSGSDLKYHHRKYFESFERELKVLWAEYMKCVEQEGLSEAAREKRRLYFEKYRSYRQNKEWVNLVSRSDD
jgi:hypothetical protein